jgi:hypothetical protein
VADIDVDVDDDVDMDIGIAIQTHAYEMMRAGRRERIRTTVYTVNCRRSLYARLTLGQRLEEECVKSSSRR